ncbi:MAG: tetratricopeptide repeat protein [Candidatus Nanopelagicaceae bacterium]
MTTPPFGRAFDLSTLKKPQVTTQTPSPTSKFGVEATAESLPKELIPLSNTKPVVILCWSERFPESKETLALLAKLNQEDQESWQLATVEVEKESHVAQALQTRVVPYAVAIIKEQVRPLFENPYPEDQLRMVIDKVLSISAEQGIGQAPIERTEPEEDEAMAALQSGDLDGAINAFERLISRKPNDAMAKSGLAQMQLLKRTQVLKPQEVISKANENPLDVNAQINCADLEVTSGKLEDALARLLNCIRSLKDEDQKLAKEHLLNLFSLVDPADPRLIQARKELASALF